MPFVEDSRRRYTPVQNAIYYIQGASGAPDNASYTIDFAWGTSFSTFSTSNTSSYIVWALNLQEDVSAWSDGPELNDGGRVYFRLTGSHAGIAGNNFITGFSDGGSGYTWGQSQLGVDPQPTEFSEVQTISFVTPPTAGTWTLSLDDQTTGELSYTAGAYEVQCALAYLSNIGWGNVSVSGSGTTSNPFTVTFDSALAWQNMSQLSVNCSNLWLSNSAPTDISLSNTRVNESQPVGTYVGTLTTTDADSGSGDQFTYTIVGGDTDAFTISGNRLLTHAVFAYATKPSYTIDVRSTDLGGLSVTKTYTILVNTLAFTSGTPSGTYGGSTTLIATLSSGGTGVAGEIIAFSFNGTSVGTAVTNTSGVATLTGVSLAGINAGTYTAYVGAGFAGNSIYAASNTTANLLITARSITVTGITANKEYDGTTDTTLDTTGAVLAGVIGEDTVTLNVATAAGTFDNKDVGTGKTVTVTGLGLSGTAAGNYSLTQPTGLTADITAKTITVTGITANNRVYDGTTASTIDTTGAVLAGVIAGDTVTLNVATAAGTFDNKNVGTGKTVTVTGLGLSGFDVGNYSLTQPTELTADITAKTLTITANDASKPYGGTDPSFSVSYAGFAVGENSSILGGVLTFTTDEPASGNAPAGTYQIIPAGLTSDNYSITYVPGTLTVVSTNRAPSGISLGITSVAENQPIGTLVGTFSTTDQDANDTFTYTLVAGTGSTDNASFSIDGEDLVTAEIFNYETKSPYSICVRSTDQDGLWYEKVFTITVTNVNEAPELDNNATYTLTGINEDPTDNPGTLVSTLLSDHAKDQDGNSLGIAVTEVATSSGHWQYSGSNGWVEMGTLTVTASLLLSGDSRIRFVPNADWNGDLPSAITFRAWDQTTGSNGETADTSTDNTGGATAFSADIATASISVAAVNDAPSFIKGANLTVNQGAGVQEVYGWATSISRGASNEYDQQLEFVVTTDNNAIFETLPILDPNTGTLTYTPASDRFGVAPVTVHLKDDGGTANGGVDSSTQTFTITVVARAQIVSISDARVEGTPITAISIDTGAGGSGNPTYAWEVYKDGDTIPFAVSSEGATTSFTFIPDDNGSYRIVFITSDSNGTCSASETIAVANANPCFDTPPFSVAGQMTVANPITVSGTATDPAGVNDTLTYSWVAYKGDSTTPFATGGNSTTFSFTPDASGNYRVVFTVCDEDGGSASAVQSVTVANATVYWRGGYDNLWTTAANWSTGFLPGATDTVVIDVTGTLPIVVSGTTTAITINSLVCANNLEIDSGSLTVTSGALLKGTTIVTGDATGSIVGKLTMAGNVMYLGDLIVKQTGILKIGEREVRGGELEISGTEVFFSWSGVTNGTSTTCTLRQSTDGVNYSVIDSQAATAATYLAAGLARGTSYYFRAVATSSNGGRLIYDGGEVVTTTAADTSAWYRVTSLTNNSDGSTPDLATIGLTDVSWVFAGSELGAFLKTVSNNQLVTDGSAPTIDPSGAITLWRRVYNHVTTYTYDSTRYPAGAYSEPNNTKGYVFNSLDATKDSGPLDATQNKSKDPIRYYDGAVDYSVTDTASDGLGSGFSLSRSWTLSTAWATGQLIGRGWIDDSLPTLLQLDGDDSIAVIYSALNIVVMNWDSTDGQYVPNHYTADSLVHDKTNHRFILTDSSGNQSTYYDFSVSANPQGQFITKTDAYGLVTEVFERTASGAIQKLRRYDANGTPVEEWVYTYISASAAYNAGLRESVTLWQLQNGELKETQTTSYSYYNGTYLGADRYGSLGDLKTVIVTKAGGTVLDTHYYRYFPANLAYNEYGEGGFRGLKFVFDSESFANVSAAVGDPYTASDVDILPYAQHGFEYNETGRVVRHHLLGSGTFSYVYLESNCSSGSFGGDTNSVLYQTIETTPDGSVSHIYCNTSGATILKVIYADSTRTQQTGGELYRYDNAGRVILQTEGDALAGMANMVVPYEYNDGNYIHVSDTEGTIYLYEYASDNTATATDAGNVKGLLKTTKVRHGEMGTDVLLKSTTYYLTTSDNQTTALLASDTVYTDGTTGTAQTTTYAYTWYAGTSKVRWITQTLPFVSVNNTLTSPVYQYEYDNQGRLTKTIENYHDGLYSPTSPTEDVTTTYTYDSLGRVTQTVQNYVDGQATSTTPTEDVTTTYAYDSLGRVTKKTDPDGNVTYYVYNDVTREIRTYAGWNSTTNNTTGAITVYREDLAGNYTETPTYTWNDSSGLPVNTDGSPAGTESLASPYAALQSLTRSLKNAAGQVEATREYFNLTGLTYSTSRDLGTKYDASHLNGNYYQTDSTYGTWGDLTSVTDALGHTTNYQHNAQGQVTEVCQNFVDGVHQSNEAADQDIITTYEYDLNGNLVSTTTAAGITTKYTYNYLGQVITVCEDYRDGVQQSTETDQDIITTYTYDVLGHLLTVTDANGNTTTYTYNAVGEKTSTTDALSNTTTYGYDANGNLVSATDGEGHTTTYVYDALGELTSTTDANSDTTTYTYDALGHVLTLTDASANTTSYTYDALGRVLTETNELGATRSYVYDAVGEVIRKIDRDGRIVEYQYDALGRKTEEDWLDAGGNNVTAKNTYRYDALGELTAAASFTNPQSLVPNTSYTYTYDALGRVTSTTEVLAGLSATIVLSYEYDLAGNCTQEACTIGGPADYQEATTIDGTADYVTDYTYDAMGRVTSIRQYGVAGGNAVAEKRIDFTYDALGQYATITRYADPAGMKLVATATYTFDDAYELVGLVYTNGTTSLAHYAYTYDDAGNMTQMVSGDGTVGYTNDDTGQLTAADSSYSDDESYAYDDSGNRVTANGSTYVTGADNRLLSDGTYAYAYDAEGNRTAKFVDTDADGVLDAGDTDITAYTWDYRNRLTEVDHFAAYTNYAADTSDQIVRYTYDAFNHLIGRTLDSDGSAANVEDLQKSVYVYDGGQVALQFDGTSSPLPPGEGQGEGTPLSASNLSHRYLWNPQAVDQLFADEDVAHEKVLYALTDHEGTIRDLVTYDADTDISTVANHRVYDSYGNLKSETANAAVDCLFGYTGRQYDKATDLQNNLNRWYDPAVGRWVSEDPIGIAAGDPNFYRYCGNRPTRWRDPSGLATFVVPALARPVSPLTLNIGGKVYPVGGCMYCHAIANFGTTNFPDASPDAFENLNNAGTFVRDNAAAALIGNVVGGAAGKNVPAGRKLCQEGKRRLAKELGGVPRSAQPEAQGTNGQGGRWWQYRDSNGAPKIVVEHPDGTVHVGTPKPQSTHQQGGVPKYYPVPGTGHVGEE